MPTSHTSKAKQLTIRIGGIHRGWDWGGGIHEDVASDMVSVDSSWLFGLKSQHPEEISIGFYQRFDMYE